MARCISRKFVDYYILSTTSATIKGAKEKEEEREKEEKKKRDRAVETDMDKKDCERDPQGRQEEGREVEERKRASSISQINASRKATLS